MITRANRIDVLPHERWQTATRDTRDIGVAWSAYQGREEANGSAANVKTGLTRALSELQSAVSARSVPAAIWRGGLRADVLAQHGRRVATRTDASLRAMERAVVEGQGQALVAQARVCLELVDGMERLY